MNTTAATQPQTTPIAAIRRLSLRPQPSRKFTSRLLRFIRLGADALRGGTRWLFEPLTPNPTRAALLSHSKSTEHLIRKGQNDKRAAQSSSPRL